MNVWDNLPNADLINQVLGDLRANSEEFAKSQSLAVKEVQKCSIRTAALRTALEAVSGPPWTGTRDAILALVAYDDSDKYLSMTYDQLRIWAELSEDPAAVLLLPYVLVREQLAKKQDYA